MDFEVQSLYFYNLSIADKFQDTETLNCLIVLNGVPGKIHIKQQAQLSLVIISLGIMPI